MAKGWWIQQKMIWKQIFLSLVLVVWLSGRILARKYVRTGNQNMLWLKPKHDLNETKTCFGWQRKHVFVLAKTCIDNLQQWNESIIAIPIILLNLTR
jgi:hypothetical protein